MPYKSKLRAAIATYNQNLQTKFDYEDRLKHFKRIACDCTADRAIINFLQQKISDMEKTCKQSDAIVNHIKFKEHSMVKEMARLRGEAKLTGQKPETCQCNDQDTIDYYTGECSKCGLSIYVSKFMSA